MYDTFCRIQLEIKLKITFINSCINIEIKSRVNRLTGYSVATNLQNVPEDGRIRRYIDAYLLPC